MGKIAAPRGGGGKQRNHTFGNMYHISGGFHPECYIDSDDFKYLDIYSSGATSYIRFTAQKTGKARIRLSTFLQAYGTCYMQVLTEQQKIYELSASNAAVNYSMDLSVSQGDIIKILLYKSAYTSNSTTLITYEMFCLI